MRLGDVVLVNDRVRSGEVQVIQLYQKRSEGLLKLGTLRVSANSLLQVEAQGALNLGINRGKLFEDLLTIDPQAREEYLKPYWLIRFSYLLDTIIRPILIKELSRLGLTDEQVKANAARVILERMRGNPEDEKEKIRNILKKLFNSAMSNFPSSPAPEDNREPTVQGLKAMLKKRGGIDFTSDKILQIKSSSGGVKFNINPAMLAQLKNAPGLVPVILNIQPMDDLQGFLGLNLDNPVI